MGKVKFPKANILNVGQLARQMRISNDNGDRFCFILGAGASVESDIPTGCDLEVAWMDYLMGKGPDKYEKPDPRTSEKSSSRKPSEPCDPEQTKKTAAEMREDGTLIFPFDETIAAWEEEKAWRKAKAEGSSTPFEWTYNFSDYYFDIYRLRFHPAKKNGFRYLEKIMEGCTPSIGYHTLALLLTKNNRNNLVITTNFDSLVEDALFLYSDKKPLVVNHESLADFIDPNIQRPIIAKVHRGLFYDPMNSPDTKLSKEWKAILDNLFAVYTPIVIGYSGSDHSLMDYLEKNKRIHQIYWCFRDRLEELPDRVKNLVLKKGGSLVSIQGFDAMMLDIGTKLYLEDMAPKSTERNQNDKLKARMEQYQKRWSAWKEKNASPEMKEQIQQMENAEKYSELIDNAFQAVSKEDYSTALNYFTEAINFNDEPFAGDFYNRGLTYYNLEKYNEAIADYSKAIELKPDYADAYINRGNAYCNLNKYDEALADYNKAIDLKPDDVDAYCNRGSIYGKLGKINEAFADFSKAIDLKPDFAVAYTGRGVAFWYLGKYNKAIVDFNKAIELKPDYVRAYNNRGNVYGKLGKYNEAIADFNKAIELKPDDEEAYYNRGNAYCDLNKYEEALADFSKAIELKPDDAEAYNCRGFVYAKQGVFEKAFQDIGYALKLAPDEPNALHSLGFTYMKRGEEGDREKALELFTKVISLDASLVDAYEDRAKIYREMGEIALAEQDEARAEELKQKQKAKIP